MHDSIRKQFPSKPRVDQFFQQEIPGLPIPQPRSYWHDVVQLPTGELQFAPATLVKKPNYKIYSMHALGSWKAHYNLARMEHLTDAVQAPAPPVQPNFANVGQPLQVQQDIAQAQEDHAFDAHYREYLDNGWASETALHFAAENNIDMSSLPGNPPYDVIQIQSAFNAGECEPLYWLTFIFISFIKPFYWKLRHFSQISPTHDS